MISLANPNSPIDVYYDMDIAAICNHFGKSRNTVDKAVAKLVKNYPDEGYKYKNPATKRITIKAEGVEILSTYFRKEKHEISTVESELRMEIEKLNAILSEKEKTIANLELLYQERLNLELDKSRQTFLLEQKTKDDQIQEQKSLLEEQNSLIEDSKSQISQLKSENQKLKDQTDTLQQVTDDFASKQEEMKEEISNLKDYQDLVKRKEEEYNSKSFFYRLTHKFSLD